MNTLFEMPSIQERASGYDPLDRLMEFGSDYLSNTDLLQIVIGDRQTAANILHRCDNNLREIGKLSLHELAKIPGMSKRKAAKLVTVLEIGRRRAGTLPKDRKVLAQSSDVVDYLRSNMQDLPHEVFCCIYLNRANKILKCERVSSGGITGTVADPRIILKRALEENACTLILSHNHPSGSVKPSKADEEPTYKIKEAAKYFDIKVIDHVIVSEDGYYSFADEGIL